MTSEGDVAPLMNRSRSALLARGVSRQDLENNDPAGLYGVGGTPALVVEFFAECLRHSSKALPQYDMEGVQTALAPGSAAALLSPVNPSIATISMRSRHVSGREAAKF